MHNRYHTSLCRTNTLLCNTIPSHTKHDMCTQNSNLTLQNNTHLRPNLAFTQLVSQHLPHKTKLFATIQQRYNTQLYFTIACYKNNATILLQNAATPYFSLQSLYTEKYSCTKRHQTLLYLYKIQWNKFNFSLTLLYTNLPYHYRHTITHGHTKPYRSTTLPYQAQPKPKY